MADADVDCGAVFASEPEVWNTSCELEKSALGFALGPVVSVTPGPPPLDCEFVFVLGVALVVASSWPDEGFGRPDRSLLFAVEGPLNPVPALATRCEIEGGLFEDAVFGGGGLTKGF